MATQKFKLAVNNAKFPFLYSRAGRSVVQPGLDVAPRTSVGFVGGPESYDYNMVAIIYAENVLPMAEGVFSVGKQDALPAYSAPVVNFDQLITLRDSSERSFLFSPARGQNYLWNDTTKIWATHNTFAWSAVRSLVTRAYVNGRTFILYEGDRLIEWNASTSSFDTLTLTLPAGYTMANIRSCLGASNYLILLTDVEVLWSSALNILDFADPIGKAGKQTPIDLKGQLTCGVPISGGFVVYTDRNAVGAFFTNNPDLPFSFREIQGSGGVATYEQVTSEANQAQHYTYGSSGIQLVTLQSAVPILPDCADFLSSHDYETWDTGSGQVVFSVLLGALDVKLQYLANRYLVVSYGKISGQFTYALFYDEALKRWGKIRCDHIDVTVLPTSIAAALDLRIFELTSPISRYEMAIQDLVSAYAAVLPLRAGFAFLQNTGLVKALVADTSVATEGGVVILGHVQVARSRLITHQRFVADGLEPAPVPKVRLLTSSSGNGHARDGIFTPTLFAERPTQRSYVGRVTCENFDIAIEGKFALTSGIVETTVHGSR